MDWTHRLTKRKLAIPMAACIPLLIIFGSITGGAGTPSLAKPMQMPNCVDYAIIQDGRSILSGVAEFPHTPREFEHGMKFREEIPDDAAMIFDTRKLSEVVFWMQDTPEPLDIAFFDIGQQLTFVHESAAPLSETYIWDPQNLRPSYVIELKGGKSSMIGMRVGEARLLVAPPAPCSIQDRKGNDT